MLGDMFSFMDMAGNLEDRKVGRYKEGDVFVSTVSVTDGREPYETAVGHPLYNDSSLVIVECYSTKGEAQAGHDRWVKTMTANELPDELRDCSNAGISQLVEGLGGDMVFPKKEE